MLAVGNIRLRPETEQDLSFLNRLYAESRMWEIKQGNWSKEEIGPFLRQQFSLQRHHYKTYYGDASFDIVECNGDAIGRLYVHRQPHDIRVVDIALMPEWCGRGIGTKLLSDVLAEGRRQNTRVSIHVERLNPAMKLYTRLGFKTAGEEGAYFLMQWQPSKAA